MEPSFTTKFANENSRITDYNIKNLIYLTAKNVIYLESLAAQPNPLSDLIL